jgi:type VI secretion system protein ImpJ
MAVNNRVVWHEGLFVRPQHFQQETRYLEHYVNQRIDSYNEFLYGLTELRFDEKLLRTGKLAIERAQGVMPDGSVFDIPNDTPQPEPLSIQDLTAVNQIVYLALPIRTQRSEMKWSESQSNARYVIEDHEIKDLHSEDGDFNPLKTATFTFSLKLEKDDISSYSTLAITQIKDRLDNNTVILNENFYPTSFAVSVIPKLERFMDEITNLINQRAKDLSARIGSPDQAGVADVADFLLLQTLNRLHPRIKHLSSLRLLHPERLYAALVEACGELATFKDGDQRFAEEYQAYQHNEPQACFTSLERLLREALARVGQPNAISITIKKQNYGVYQAVLPNASLIKSHDFIFAVKAHMELGQLRDQLLHQVKISSLEKVSDLVSRQLPGIPLRPIPVAPRHLPYHAGFIYFELDRSSEEWHQMMQDTAGFAFHIAGEFPELALEFWALRKE